MLDGPDEIENLYFHHVVWRKSVTNYTSVYIQSALQYCSSKTVITSIFSSCCSDECKNLELI